MLCEKCSNINLDDLEGPRSAGGGHIVLHDNFEKLQESANTGCDFCVIVYESIKAKAEGSPGVLAKLRDEPVQLGTPSRARDWLVTKEQGNSDLYAWIGRGRIQRPYPYESRQISVRFLLCLPRSDKEWDTGQLDLTNPGSHCITGRPTFSHASSPDAIRLSQTWLRQCLNKDQSGSFLHTACHQHSRAIPDEGFVPTRTINVGSDDPPQEPFLEVHDHEKGPVPFSKFEWAALSHCWGGTSPLTTTTKTISERIQGVPLETMPRTFRDAVLTARRFGIQHLWIDSLCILQDCSSDWNRESSLMAKVYRFSVVNVAADAACHADDGFLKPRAEKPILASLPFYSKKHGLSEQMLVCPAVDNWMTTLSVGKSYLASRGWVLQENLLSPRTIHFAAQQILWECPTTIIAESDMKPHLERFPGKNYPPDDWDWHFSKRFCFPKISAVTRRDVETDQQIWYNKWYMILTDYSKRRLTLSRDIFPALSGLQSEFSKYINNQCLAGLFVGDLHRGLLWEVELFDEVKRPVTYRAPTWSWASVEGSVKWPFDMNSELIPGYQIGFVDSNISTDSTVLEQHSSWTSLIPKGATILKSSSQENFYIRLRGRWRSTSSWNEVKAPTDTGGWFMYDQHGMTHASCLFDVGSYKDHIAPHFTKGDWGLLQIATWDLYSHVDTVRVLYALVLKPVPDEEDVYERIGVAHIYTDEIPTTAAELDWEVKTLKIV